MGHPARLAAPALGIRLAGGDRARITERRRRAHRPVRGHAAPTWRSRDRSAWRLWIVIAVVVLVLGADRPVPEAAGARRRARSSALAAAGVDGGHSRRLAEVMDSTPRRLVAWPIRTSPTRSSGPDAELESALVAQREAGLPEIEVAPVAGKLLNLLVRISGARGVLEIGHARRLFDDLARPRRRFRRPRRGRSRSEAENAPVARASIDAAGCRRPGRHPHRQGRRGAADSGRRFDLVFIDADKESNTVYLDWAARLGHSGTVVVLDNIGREGEIVRDDSTDSKVIGTRDGLRMLGRTRASTPRRCRRSGRRAGTASRSPSVV